jgi:hypothetical protein
MKKLIAVFAITLVSLFTAYTLKLAFDFNPLITGGLCFISGFVPFPGNVCAILAYTAAGGAATAFSWNMVYVPEFITYNPGANPLTSLKISTKKHGVLHDWLAASIAAINGFMMMGALPANNVLLRCATGDIQNQDVTISGVTSAAGAVNFFCSSDNVNKNALCFRTKNATALALTPTRFDNFCALFIPAMQTTTDKAEVFYNNGHRQIYDEQELQALTPLYQQTNNIIINNIKGAIKSVDITCAAATPVYILEIFKI